MKVILKKIDDAQERLTPKQKKIAKYVIENYKNVAFMNSVELAQLLQVSTPTILRFTTALGYDNYGGFQNFLHSIVQNELSSLDRIQKPPVSKTTEQKESIFDLEIINISDSCSIINSDEYFSALSLLDKARNIFVGGWQVSSALSEYSYYSLNKIRENIFKIEDDYFKLYEKIKSDDTGNVALIYALPRYPNKTLAMIKKLHFHNVKTIVVTDSLFFPYREYCDVILPMSIRYTSFVDPISSLFCLINQLLSDMAKVNDGKTLKNLKLFENFLEEEDIYYTANT